MWEHKCGVTMGALGGTNHDYEISKSNSCQSGMRWDQRCYDLTRQPVWQLQWSYMFQKWVIQFLYALKRGHASEVQPYVTVRVSRGTVRSAYIVHGLSDSLRESTRAWWITLPCWRRKMCSTTWENTSRWAAWVVSCWTWPGWGWVMVRNSECQMSDHSNSLTFDCMHSVKYCR
jgi:hypothetical protein